MNASKSEHLQITFRSLAELIPYARNARTHSDAQIAQIAASIHEFGWTNPILADTDGIVAGHGRLLGGALLYSQGKRIKLPSGQEIPEGTAPVLDCTGWSQAKRRAYILADNRLALNAGWDHDMLMAELHALQEETFNLETLGFSLEELEGLLGDSMETGSSSTGSLVEKFVVPPLSILDTRQGYWAERRSAWMDIGIESELGRAGNLCYSSSSQPPEVYEAKNAAEARLGRKISWEEFFQAHPEQYRQPGTSIFDPVLCEIAYRWFCPPAGQVLDPFAGGSVRGVVAGLLGRSYLGLELRGDQVEANREQAARILTSGGASWVQTDSLRMDDVLPGEFQADLLFSCPPYVDLEVYSDDPADLSNKGYPEFLALYRAIIAKAVARLRPDRFAVWVVGEVRGKDGRNLGFVPDTIRAFEDAGAVFYNEAILVNQVASAATRAGRTFEAARKLCKVHQNVLVFLKGNAKRATSAVGAVECGPVQESSE